MKKYRTQITLEIVFDGDEVDDPALWDYAMLFDLVGEDSVRVLSSETERVVNEEA